MEPVIKESNCINCRTYFIENQQLPLEDITTEFKLYDLPIKQIKHKFTILKTITAFLNTKGGTLFFGVQDQKCSVKGNYLTKKQQDQLKFFIKDLACRIHPKLDFSNKEDVQTFFIPVLNHQKKFLGKYIVKILVNQGLRDIVYSFAEKVKITSDKGEIQQFEIRNSYRRISAGGIQSLKILQIFEQIYRKAKNPNEEHKIHENCNPKPIQPTIQFNTICFKRVDKDIKKKLIQTFQSFLEDSPMDHQIEYNQEQKILKIIFKQQDDAEEIKDTLLENLVYLNTEDYIFEFDGEEVDTYVFSKKNLKNHQENNNEQKNDKKVLPPPKKKQTLKKIVNQQKFYKGTQQQKSLNYVITHIKPKSGDKLIEYLNSIFKKSFKFQQFINTILIQSQNQQQLKYISKTLEQKQKQLRQFGHNKQIILGIPTGHIHIYNYYQKQRQNLKAYVTQLLYGGIKSIEFKKDEHDKTRTYMDLVFQASETPFALDCILLDEQIRQFRIYDKDRDVPKMKFMLICR